MLAGTWNTPDYGTTYGLVTATKSPTYLQRGPFKQKNGRINGAVICTFNTETQAETEVKIVNYLPSDTFVAMR